jgi:hypothetical protein
MRPLAVLNAIVFGSAAAITFGLAGVLVIFLVLQGQYPQMRAEFPVLVRSSALFALLAGISGASLLGMLKGRRWRWLAHAAMWLVVAGIAALYWPRYGAGHGGIPQKALRQVLAKEFAGNGALHLSALVDAFPGVTFLERAAVVRIEAFASRTFLADGRRAGLLCGATRRRREARGLVRVLDLVVTPAKPLGEPHDRYSSRTTTKSRGSFRLVSRKITRAGLRENPQSREL